MIHKKKQKLTTTVTLMCWEIPHHPNVVRLYPGSDCVFMHNSALSQRSQATQ